MSTNQKLLKALMTAAAYQREGHMTHAASLFTKVSAHAGFPALAADFLKKEEAATARTERTRASTVDNLWPFRQTAGRVRAADKDDEEDMDDDEDDEPTKEKADADDDIDFSFGGDFSVEAGVMDMDFDVENDKGMEVAGIEDDFVDMGLEDDDLMLEMSSAKDDEDDEDEDEDEDENDGKKEKAARATASFARQCRNLQAVTAAAKTKAKAKGKGLPFGGKQAPPFKKGGDK